MKILNLYACLGGNRYKWNEVADECGVNIEVTAVELDKELARIYKERFPMDNVIVTDAHQYLLDNYKEFDFIWSSPPCPTHSRINISQYTRNSFTPRYPDMKLYQEIIFLKHFFKGKFCVENVIPYYEPLIVGTKRGRHLYWSNFNIPNYKERDAKIREFQIKDLEQHHDINLDRYKGKQNKRKILRNLVDYEAGKEILRSVIGFSVKKEVNQLDLF